LTIVLEVNRDPCSQFCSHFCDLIVVLEVNSWVISPLLFKADEFRRSRLSWHRKQKPSVAIGCEGRLLNADKNPQELSDLLRRQFSATFTDLLTATVADLQSPQSLGPSKQLLFGNAAKRHKDNRQSSAIIRLFRFVTRATQIQTVPVQHTAFCFV